MMDMLKIFHANVLHYAHALFGLRCRFLPNAADLGGVHRYAVVSVLEYRGMVLVVAVAALLGTLEKHAANDLGFLLLAYLWLMASISRAWSFRSRWAFWSRLFHEEPRPHPRIEGQYIEAGIEEMQYRFKAGVDASKLEAEITSAINNVGR